MNAMILAAGKGTRLYPLTESLPKPMAPVSGKPVLEHTVLWLRRYGIRRIAVNLHHLPESVRSHFGDGSGFGVELHYSVEDELLGTAGGVKKCEGFLEDEFIVVYGDVLAEFNLDLLISYHRSCDRNPHATLTLDRRPDAAQCGVVELDANNRILSFVEKPRPEAIRSSWVNSGIMIVDKVLLSRIPAGKFSDFGRDVLPAWLREGAPLWGWRLPKDGYLIDIGTPEKYAQAESDWAQRR